MHLDLQQIWIRIYIIHPEPAALHHALFLPSSLAAWDGDAVFPEPTPPPDLDLDLLAAETCDAAAAAG